jgi:hypothetical protein
MYVSRNVDPSVTYGTDTSGQVSQSQPPPSDLRRICYWLGSNGGLCRQELPYFSSDSAYENNTSYIDEGKSEDSYVIAPEVTSLTFEYYDCNSTTDDGGWNSYWTGSNPGPDNVTPTGPPTAIRITFSLKSNHPKDADGTKKYVHVLPILTASGPNSNTGTSTILTSN